ncbi:acyl carrier protein [Amycolatopsis lurida]
MPGVSEKDLLDRVRDVWAEVLDVPTVAVDANFFEAGGDSVLLIVLLDQLNEMTDRVLEPPDLFQHSTVRAQAALLAGGAEQPAAPQPEPAGRRALLGRAQRGQNGGS